MESVPGDRTYFCVQCLNEMTASECCLFFHYCCHLELLEREMAALAYLRKWVIIKPGNACFALTVFPLPLEG